MTSKCEFKSTQKTEKTWFGAKTNTCRCNFIQFDRKVYISVSVGFSKHVFLVSGNQLVVSNVILSTQCYQSTNASSETNQLSAVFSNLQL